MKQCKKIISLLLVVVLLASFITIPGNAISEPTITVSSVQGSAGDTVDINIDLVNNPGIICAQLTVTYNSTALELVEVNDTGLLPGKLHTPALSSPYTLTWANGTATEDYTVVGTIVTLKFKIKTTAAIGNVYSINVSYDYDNYEIYNFNFDPIEFSIQNGSISVVCPHKLTVATPKVPPTCNTPGYTLGIRCRYCGEFIQGREIIPATGIHEDADGNWDTNGTSHWHVCTCGTEFDKVAHSGGEASCKNVAVCEICGVGYGATNPDNHINTEIRFPQSPDCDSDGYTGDIFCWDCGKTLPGDSIPATGNHKGGEANCTHQAICDVCDKPYGELNPKKHTGRVTYVGNVTPDCGNSGYRGDGYCTDCGVLVEPGYYLWPTGEHTGGHATCTEKAICEVCGNPYGEFALHDYTAQNVKPEALKTEGNCRDEAVYYYSCSVCGEVENNNSHIFNGDKVPSTHVGGTTIVNAAEPNHKGQTDGYTGDTKCLGCNEILSYGQSIPVGAHTPANIWSSDENNHWKECNIVGCGVVIDGSKAPHSSYKDENKATCQKQAVCDVCGVSYGSVAEHDYTAEAKKPDALKTAGNCRDNAVYYYSCSVCGLVENDDNHTFLGDKVANTHVGGTTIVNASEANHKTQTDGYTGDTKCLGCNEIIAYGQVILAGEHTPANAWTTDGTHHWKECTVENCGTVIDGTKATHTATGANVATCKTQAICDICGTAHGALNAENHTGGTTIVNASEPNHKAQIDGYTGDTKCLGCNNIIAYGQVIPADTHTPASDWTTDETHHWKECTVVGCGVVIEGSKAAHTSTGANVATCQKQAVCDVCGVSFGSVAEHDYSADDKKQDALKTEGTCRDEAVYYYSCSVCGLVENNDTHTFLGDKVAITHVGGTTIVNASEAAHKTQTDGYTGDTKCLGCGVITAYGQAIPAGAHNPANTWTTDETHHWKECTVVGCGVVIDGSKAAHTSTGANVSTCQKQAVCDICGVSYGAVADHDFANTLSKDATGHWYACQTEGCTEKDGFAQHTPDHDGGATEEYAIKCSICLFEIEAQLGHTHVFDKEVAEDQYLASNANCTDPAKYYKSCKCGEKGTETFTSGEELGHTEGTAWEKDATGHWHTCTVAGCGVIIDTSKAEHTPDREAATETDPIKCSVCGYEISPVLTHTHAHGGEWKSDKDNHWNECACGDKANTAAHKDENTDGKCDTCEYVVSVPDNDNPQTRDNSMISLWIILLCVSGLGIVVTTVYRKKRMF